MRRDLTIEKAEPSGLAGSEREQEAADQTSQSPGGVKIDPVPRTASRERIDSWLASLAAENTQGNSDGVSPKPTISRPHSAPPKVVHPPRLLANRSHPIDASQLAEGLSSLHLPTPSLSPPGNFFTPLNSPYSPWPHGSSSTLVDHPIATPSASSLSEMYHFPQPPDFLTSYQWRMAHFFAHSLDQVLESSAIPIGSDAGLRLRPYNSVVLVENIPYSVTRHEVAQFFGRDARLADGFPIHLIMERSTGKTMDCFVEFASAHDAQAAVDRVKKLHDASQGPRMGNRYVDVSLSSQDVLMKALFPRAKCIKWEGGRPVIVPKHPQEQDLSGFVGFLTDEELFCVGRHAREPHRSTYANKVPQRTYESMISTIWKFPWYATDMYTVWARNQVYKTLLAMVEALAKRLGNSQTVGLDIRLLSELVRAGVECPAFNPRMKYRLAHVSGDQDFLRRMHKDWLRLFPFDSLTWLRPNDVVALEFYGMLISRGYPASLPDGLELAPEELPDHPYLYGRWWFLWGHQESKDIMFLDAINAEMKVLRDLLISGFHAMQAERSAWAANVRPAASAWANTQPVGIPPMGGAQPEQEAPHWPGQGPNPFVAGAVAPEPVVSPAPTGASTAPRPPVVPVAPRRLGSPAQIVPRASGLFSGQQSSSMPAPRRAPGPRGPHGPHGPFGPGNWRGNSSGPSRR